MAALIAGILFDMASAPAFYCFFISLSLVLLSFIFRWAPVWKELLLLATTAACGLAISASSPSSPDINRIYFISARCDEVLPHRNYILSAHQQHYYLSHFHTDTTYETGDSLHFRARILPLQENANPGEFSYARYLKQKDVLYRLIPLSAIRQKGHSDNLSTYFGRLRKRLIAKTRQLFPDTTCHQLIAALCLGYKNDLDSELHQLFISTGTVHLLSVSGLHTGAIYLLILFFLKKSGCPARLTHLLVLPFLWSYACLTGLSPSVVRAATILTFIDIGQYFNQSYTPLNSVAAAAFLTLLLRPSTLYSLSFLLSYSAYTGILTIYPFLYRYSARLPGWLAKIYACCCITIAAQLPTLPISAYYFHTLNISGVVTNLLAVPLATILLYSSMFCLLLPSIIGQYFAILPETTEKILIGFLRLSAPYSLNLKDLYPHFLTILLGYCCLIFLCLYFIRSRKKWMKYALLSVWILAGWKFIFHSRLASGKEIVVFHLYRKSTILLNYRGHYTLLYNTSDTNTTIQPYIFQNHLSPLPDHPGLLTTTLSFHDNRLCTPQDTIVLATPACIPAIQGNTLIVTGNLPPGKIFPIDHPAYPSKIILDGSHSPGQIRRWKEFCLAHGLSLANTAETGSVRIALP